MTTLLFVNVHLFALYVFFFFLVLMNEICLKSTLAYDNCNYLDCVVFFFYFFLSFSFFSIMHANCFNISISARSRDVRTDLTLAVLRSTTRRHE